MRRLGYIFGVIFAFFVVVGVLIECLVRARSFNEACAILEQRRAQIAERRLKREAYERSLAARKMSDAFAGVRKARAYA